MKMPDFDYCPNPRWPWSKRYLAKIETGPIKFTDASPSVDLRIVGPITTKRLGIRRWLKLRGAQ